MLPDIRFAIGAVLAGALLIVTAFGLAAAVRIAHHKSAAPLEGSRLLAYAEPADAPLERAVAALDLAPPAEAARAAAPEAPVRADIVTMMPLTVVAESAPEATPAGQLGETKPDEPGERIAALPPAVEVAAAAEPPPAATSPAPDKTPAAKARKTKKKVATKRTRVRTVLERPGARTGYPNGGIEFLFLRNDRAPTID